MSKAVTDRKPRAVRGSTTGRPVMALLDLLGRRWTLRFFSAFFSGLFLAEACSGIEVSLAARYG